MRCFYSWVKPPNETLLVRLIRSYIIVLYGAKDLVNSLDQVFRLFYWSRNLNIEYTS